MVELKAKTTSFKKRGNVIEYRENIEPTMLKPKDILDNIGHIEKAINQNVEGIASAEKSILTAKEYLLTNKENLKKVNQFKEWAETIQKSRLKALVEECQVDIALKVKKEYRYDNALTKEQNEAQKFSRYQRYIHVNEKVTEEIHPTIIKKWLYDSKFLPNPYN